MSLSPQRYGACASAFSVVVAEPQTRIFAFAISASNTSRPLVTKLITANGFSALTVTASARWAASSSPVDVTIPDLDVTAPRLVVLHQRQQVVVHRVFERAVGVADAVHRRGA